MPLNAEEIGPIQVSRSLGKGGMGEVLLAWDPQLERKVAIRRTRADLALDADCRVRFHREARTAARLAHPANVQVSDLLTIGEVDHIVMEYVEGTSPRKLLTKGSPLPLGEGLEIVATVADGLAYAQRQGIAASSGVTITYRAALESR